METRPGPHGAHLPEGTVGGEEKRGKRKGGRKIGQKGFLSFFYFMKPLFVTGLVTSVFLYVRSYCIGLNEHYLCYFAVSGPFNTFILNSDLV